MLSLTESYRRFTTASLKHAILMLSAEQRHYITERATFFTYCKVVKSGDTVFDLGANHGAHTVLLSEIVGPLGRVHAFEPNPTLTPALREMDANVMVHEMAIGDSNSSGVLGVPKGLDGWASLNDRRELLPEHEFQEYEVAVRVIDEIEGVRHERPTFVKIDVEGYELQALRGMKRILVEHRPPIVFENPTQEIFEFFEACNYRVFDLFGDSSFPPYEGLINVIAIPNGYPQYESLFLSERDFTFLLTEYMSWTRMPNGG